MSAGEHLIHPFSTTLPRPVGPSRILPSVSPTSRQSLTTSEREHTHPQKGDSQGVEERTHLAITRGRMRGGLQLCCCWGQHPNPSGSCVTGLPRCLFSPYPPPPRLSVPQQAGPHTCSLCLRTKPRPCTHSSGSGSNFPFSREPHPRPASDRLRSTCGASSPRAFIGSTP